MRTVVRQRGFTLIEILVVMGILSLLAVALIPNLVGAGEQRRRAETQVRRQALQNAIDTFERRHGFYPPDNFVDPLDKVKATADTVNTGIESLMIFVHQEGGGSTFVDREDWLSNTDEDENGTVIPLLERKSKVEVVDAWGVPFAYFCANAGGFAAVQRIRDQFGVEGPARAWRNPNSNGYLGARRYQLVSAGPDMVFNTDDDITWPERPRNE